MRLVASGASVIGPAHLQDNLPNQDAFNVCGVHGGVFAAVADGLGSRALSHIGSCKAVKLARDAVKQLQTAAPEKLMTCLKAQWLVACGSDFRDFDTTCLWAHVSDSGVLRLAQVGDGLVMVKSAGIFRVLTPTRDGFANQTDTLGCAKPERWTCSQIQLSQPGDGVLLLTDGISDDLIPEQLGQFFDAIYHRTSRLSKRAMRRWLEQELAQWSTPLHGDDKSLAGIFRLD
ncbi:Serine/threonine protein phosphatase PrpC [Arsukibacterium tuosuense]|uniref:Serine/threonine protein phosphatase PrpC n=1 Tax=Arsukibacterium tuosuense TaxID=1323745 RepID=A0A285JDY1_9GAMM|nr:PP2C family serine/threonine-protein phosphatase [Arsukibacterium tuosuense]SNY58500.1 Serine/threonine protein phosphatase PrpC [Arsukibacterium tuosuense]